MEIDEQVGKILQVPSEELKAVKEQLLQTIFSQDEASLSRIWELQESAKEILLLKETMRRARSHNQSESSAQFEMLVEFLLTHSQFISQGVQEAFEENKTLFENGFQELLSTIETKWTDQVKLQQQLFSDRFHFLKHSYEEKLNQAREAANHNLETTLARERAEHKQLVENLQLKFSNTKKSIQLAFAAREQDLLGQLAKEKETTCSILNTLSGSQRKLKSLEAKCKQLEIENLRLEAELGTQTGKLKGDSENAQMFISALQKQLRVALDKNERLEATNKELEEDIDKLKIGLDLKQAQIDSAERKLESTEQVLQLFREDLAQCQAQLEAVTKREKDLQTQLFQSEENLQQHHRRQTLLSSEKDSLQFRLERLEAQLEEHEETARREKKLSADKAAALQKVIVSLRSELLLKAEKIQQLQQDMLEYARLQKRVQELEAREIDVRDSVTTQLLHGVDHQQPCLERDKTSPRALSWNQSTGAWEQASQGGTSKGVKKPTKSPSIAKFMTERSLKRQGKSDLADSRGPSSSQLFPISNLAGGDQSLPPTEHRPASRRNVELSDIRKDFLLETEHLRERLEQELRESYEEDIKANIRLDFMKDLKSTFEDRIRREMTVQFRIKLHEQLRHEMKIYESTMTEGHRQALQRLDGILIDLKETVRSREEENMRLQNDLDLEKTKTAKMLLSIKEKDKLLEQFCNILQKSRHSRRREKGAPLELTVVSAPNQQQKSRPRTAPSIRPPIVKVYHLGDKPQQVQNHDEITLSPRAEHSSHKNHKNHKNHKAKIRTTSSGIRFGKVGVKELLHRRRQSLSKGASGN